MSWLRISLGWEAYIPAAGLFICWGWYTGTASVQCTVVRSVSASRPGYHHSVTLSRLPWIRSQSSWHIFLWFRNTRSLKDAQIFINKARRINMNINKLHGCEQFFNRIKLHVLFENTTFDFPEFDARISPTSVQVQRMQQLHQTSFDTLSIFRGNYQQWFLCISDDFYMIKHSFPMIRVKIFNLIHQSYWLLSLHIIQSWAWFIPRHTWEYCWHCSWRGRYCWGCWSY